MFVTKINQHRLPVVFFICTGLGRVKRGFESYIDDLAENCVKYRDFKMKLTVFAGGRLDKCSYDSVIISNVSRNSSLLQKLRINGRRAFTIEQISFFFFFLPYIFIRRPQTIYLGEYSLYCYLFKARKLLGLNFSLVLYTGGQASPGLFDPKRDYVHHITDIYYRDLIQSGVPPERQFIIPHFLNTNFEVDGNLVKQLRNKASGKKIVLSVGSIDKEVKRMHLIPAVLGDHARSVFPILLGEWTNESEEVNQLMTEHFGADGFIIGKVNRKELGSYYTAADAFILCSKKESFGLVFLEAMYFDTPVICHDFYESRFVLRDNAHFMDMDDIDSFKRTLGLLLPTLKKQPTLNLFIQQNYTWEILQGFYRGMFHKVMEISKPD
jgi:glycosyltransferase involved in cell wall biosynthesis